MSLNINYNAMTDTDLREELLWAGYILKWTEDENHLELFQFGGGYGKIKDYWEQSTGEVFDSIGQAHRFVFIP